MKDKAWPLESQVCASLAFTSAVLSTIDRPAELLRKETLQGMVVEAHHKALQFGPMCRSLDANTIAEVASLQVCSGGATWLLQGLVNETLLTDFFELDRRLLHRPACLCLIVAQTKHVMVVARVDRKLVLYICPGKIKVVKSLDELLERVVEETGPSNDELEYTLDVLFPRPKPFNQSDTVIEKPLSQTTPASSPLPASPPGGEPQTARASTPGRPSKPSAKPQASSPPKQHLSRLMKTSADVVPEDAAEDREEPQTASGDSKQTMPSREFKMVDKETSTLDLIEAQAKSSTVSSSVQTSQETMSLYTAQRIAETQTEATAPVVHLLSARTIATLPDLSTKVSQPYKQKLGHQAWWLLEDQARRMRMDKSTRLHPRESINGSIREAVQCSMERSSRAISPADQARASPLPPSQEAELDLPIDQHECRRSSAASQLQTQAERQSIVKPVAWHQGPSIFTWSSNLQGDEASDVDSNAPDSIPKFADTLTSIASAARSESAEEHAQLGAEALCSRTSFLALRTPPRSLDNDEMSSSPFQAAPRSPLKSNHFEEITRTPVRDTTPQSTPKVLPPSTPAASPIVISSSSSSPVSRHSLEEIPTLAGVGAVSKSTPPKAFESLMPSPRQHTGPTIAKALLPEPTPKSVKAFASVAKPKPMDVFLRSQQLSSRSSMDEVTEEVQDTPRQSIARKKPSIAPPPPDDEPTSKMLSDDEELEASAPTVATEMIPAGPWKPLPQVTSAYIEREEVISSVQQTKRLPPSSPPPPPPVVEKPSKPVVPAQLFVPLTPKDRATKLMELREKKLRQLQERKDKPKAESGAAGTTKKGELKPLSNRQLIHNAIETNLLAGTACEPERIRVLQALFDHPGDNFLVTFKGSVQDMKMTFKGLYALDKDSVYKVYGQGPADLDVTMVKQFFRYNSGKKAFVPVSTRSFTIKTDGAALNDDCFKRKKVQDLF
ncbi:hypothetical protein AeRB84_010134 [Aphanomyces euteiches]|nr:hypothetical protein AeRB84_010134 [Aphanomyces euteiches]